jgi:superfamily I DNA and/or RNA helicase
MKIENAIGAISRASQTVVIGDEHQLPPTSFFDVSSEDDEEEEMEEVGYESILQSAITILPGAQSELLYHYRSTSDDLIAFSNELIYDHRLITFPAPKCKGDAVQFEYVEKGIYDSGQTRRNRIEAVRVAELCIEHVQSNPSSLGVIAFSKTQEEAIREAISEKIKEFPQLADKLDEVSDKKESFFIKNLESVQGDQRDVIILSVGYGPDQNNNVYNRFGPINSKGGYRRLNVAVTRAKDKIICVSSMKFYQMNPPETSRGAVLLQKYLEYAEKGRGVLEASKILKQGLAEADSDFEISVQNSLENLGYTIHRQIGASGFSIDLAVVSPENKNEYILGIECDGAAYHSSKSARIRDRLRQQILEKLGWSFYRVWSQHWITHRQEVLSDIIEVINKKQ